MIPRLAKIPAPEPLHGTFLAELRARGFEGQLSLTHADRTVLSTDNSIYQVFPQAIAFPAGTEDLVRIATIAAEPRFRALKLAPRGGGTGTNGQSLTDGLVVEISRPHAGLRSPRTSHTPTHGGESRTRPARKRRGTRSAAEGSAPRFAT